MISVKNLVKSYSELKALKGVSFEVKKGEIVGFLGPNGAGKTTTMKILAGYMEADSGEITIDNLDGCTEALEIKKIIGYLPENNPLYLEMSVVDYLKYTADIYNIPKNQQLERINEVADQCAIKKRLHQKIGELSKGFRQRVGIAAVLLHNPDILILDEPTVGLDPNQIQEIRDLIKKLGAEKTIILCSHILSEVEATCDRILIINQGKIIAEGTPGEIRKKAKQKNRLRIVVEGKESLIWKTLESIDEVKEIIEMRESAKEIHEVLLEVSDSPQLRKEIIHGLLKVKCELLEMYLKEASLEEAFTVLTH